MAGRGNIFRTRRRGGAVLIYATAAMTAIAGIAVLSVDGGRRRVARTELQAAADSAARYAASGLEFSVATARTRASQVAAQNRVDGRNVTLDTAADVEFGVWNPTTKSFQKLTGADELSATAVRVTTRAIKARSTGVTTTIAGLFGIASSDVQATAIASRGKIVAANVNADCCPWLAGMPNSAIVAGYDGNTKDAKAPDQLPLQLTGLPLTPGTKLSFRQAGGMTSYMNAADYGPDGQTSWIVRQQPANGINATKAPLNCLVGIFLDNRAPNTYSMAAELDFTSAASRDFQTLSPGLKQVFFIGDGLDSSGRLQSFIIPAGATRFYLAIMDEKGWWWDNTGQLQTTFLDGTITMVK
jgi:hypothetical protein